MKRTLLSISALFLAAATFAQPTNGLVAEYTFNDGTPFDGIGTNHAANYNANLTTDRFGNNNQAVVFNATNLSYMSIPSSPELNFGTGDFSISLWFRTSDASNVGTIINRGEGIGNTKRIFIRTNTPNPNQIQWRLGDNYTTTQTAQGGSSAEFDNGWHHLVLIRETQSMIFYIDGVQTSYLTEPLLATSNHDNSRPFLLGAQDSVVSSNQAMGNYFTGGIDDVRFYNRALEPIEVIELLSELDEEVDLNNELLGHWSFNNGTPEDDAGTNDGVNYGSTLTQDRFGNNDNAYAFDDSYIEVNHNAALNLGSEDFAISAWFNSTNSTDAGVIINKGEGSGSVPRVFIRVNPSNANTIQYRIGHGAYNATQTLNTGGIFDGNWHHVVLVKWVGHMRFYIDGVLVDDFSNIDLNTVTVSSSRPFLFGAQDGTSATNYQPGSYFDGSIDDIRIYGRAVNDAEALELYNESNPNVVTSISEEENGALTIFPNPTNGMVYIANLNQAEVRTINLYDVTGSLVKSQPQAAQVDLTDLPKGMYLLTAEMKDGSRLTSRVARN